MEYKSNDYLGQDYERKIELEKLTPIGRMYLGKYKPMRVDNRTIRLIKQEEQHEKQI
jgi:hypothetical protein